MFTGVGRIFCRRFICSKNRFILKRCIFSRAFQLDDAWNKRLESPILKKCNLDEFFYNLDNKYSQSELLNPVDVDIFVNRCDDEFHLDEMQDLVHKFRMSRDACHILPSTHHAFVRVLLKCERYDDLLNALNDRLNYGIFPDDYAHLLMIDAFLKEGDYRRAAKVAGLYMLQEDYSNTLLNRLCVYSCLLYLQNPVEWEKEVEPPVEDADEEEIKVRVDYIRNPFFDDHFDLTKGNDIVGKTLINVGGVLDIIDCKILGSILFSKFSDAESLLKSMIKDKKKLHPDIYKVMVKHLNEIKEKGDDDTKHVTGLIELCRQIEADNLIGETDLSSVLHDCIKQDIDSTESQLIAHQQNIYEKWSEERQRSLEETLARIKREERLAKVEEVKRELVKREEQLFFFDREDSLDLEIERKEMIKQMELADDDGSKNKTDKQNQQEYVSPDKIRQR